MSDRRFKHGLVPRNNKPPEFNVWCKMRQRCSNPKSPDFQNYGGRGIAVCERWQDFAAFIADMGKRPSPAHTLERENNDKGYGPDNCIWATRDIQARNRRPRAPQSVCARAHEMSGENVYTRPDGKRGCRKCRQLNMQKFYQKRAAT